MSSKNTWANPVYCLWSEAIDHVCCFMNLELNSAQRKIHFQRPVFFPRTSYFFVHIESYQLFCDFWKIIISLPALGCLSVFQKQFSWIRLWPAGLQFFKEKVMLYKHFEIKLIIFGKNKILSRKFGKQNFRGTG